MKDFDNWNRNKKKINSLINSNFYRTREIRWCSLGVNIGFEEDGKYEHFMRPVLILVGFSRNTCLVAPLTSSVQQNKHRIGIGNIAGVEAKVILSQIRTVDTKRLGVRIAVLNKEVFDKIRKTIKDLL